jgi:tetratricopeptide (TPR) repeat protein
MHALLCSIALVSLWCLLGCGGAWAQDRSLLPKYGDGPKNEAELAADAKFVAWIEQQYNGDLKKASHETAASGWQALRENRHADAMRRFNQAWLLNPSSGQALWGMGAVLGSNGKLADALNLFQEAAPSFDDDLEFTADHARTLGMAGVQSGSEALIRQALSRFAAVYERAPDHTLNLQNWAITLFALGNHAEAWRKVMLAEATPRRAELDPAFIAALQKKMPRH